LSTSQATTKESLNPKDKMKHINKYNCCLLLLSLFLLSCSNKSNWDKFIEKYDKDGFSEFQNSFIAFRGNYENDNIYLISKCEDDLPVYLVTVDIRTQEIKEIDRSMLIEHNQKDYFTNSEINSLIKSFLKYDFYLLSCDNNLNIMVNPFESNEPARLLRVNEKAGISDKIKGYFTHYKNNWYIRDYNPK
jgi:hypothetical protein